MRSHLTALLTLASISLAGTASANMAAVRRDPGRLAGPAVARETSLRVLGEKLSFTCAEREKVPECTFEARYEIENTSAEAEEVAAAFLGVRTHDIQVRVDGAPPRAVPTSTELSAIVEAAAKLAGERPPHGAPLRPHDHAGFVLSAEPGSRHQVVLTGRVSAGRRWEPSSYALPAVNARHLLVSTRKPEADRYDLEYLISPIRTWKGNPTIEVRVSYPSRWTVSVTGAERSRSPQSGEELLQASLKARAADTLDIEIAVPRPAFHNGGPLVAIGGTTGGNHGVRGRIGYEVAAPSWLLFQLAADTDFRRRFIVAPVVEAATPAMLIIPSFGLGAGLPVQIRPDPRVGARIQGDLHLYSLGFVTSVDIYPRMGGLAGFTEVSLLAQIGL